MNEELVKYIKEHVFPVYEMNDKGHDLKHIEYVINRSFDLSKNLNLNLNMIYVAASYHDIGHHLDAGKHEVVSAKIFEEDDRMHDFFNDDEIKIIKEAIEDHRASLEYEPRSIYGKLLSSADRNIDIDSYLRRIYWYGLKHYAEFTIEQHIDRGFNHLKEKFGISGYAKMYMIDDKHKKYLEEVNELTSNRDIFAKKFKKVNGLN